jgi:hypothetical protein
MKYATMAERYKIRNNAVMHHISMLALNMGR